MRRASSVAIAFALVVALVGPGTVGAAPQPGAITWAVDHRAKTITVNVQLEIYPGCSGNPSGTASEQAAACRGGGGQVTRLLAEKLKSAIERVWKNLSYRCYKLIFNVDIKLGTDRRSVPEDRIGVRIDPSPAGIRDYVDSGYEYDPANWQSEAPEDRVEPTNHGPHETTWSESTQESRVRIPDTDGRLVWVESHVAAHEFGHLLGLHDGYHDETDPQTGEVRSVPNEGAPDDLMTDTRRGTLDQSSVDRLVRRSQNDLLDTSGRRVRLDDLRCNYTLQVDIRMTGARPEFNAEIVATGTIELRDLGRPAGTQGGAPVTHEGLGNLAFVVTPRPRKACTFGYEGSGGFPIGARASIPTPFDAEKIVITLAPKLDRLGRDTLIAWPCQGTKEYRQAVGPLFTAFYTDRLGTEWRITDWDPAGGARPAVADGWWSGRCAVNACRESDVFKLSEAP